MLHYWKWQVMSAVSHLIVIAETSSHGMSTGSPHLMIGIIAGLLSTLVILAFLIVVLIKVHTRRHPPPPVSTFETATATASNTAVTASNNSSSSSGSANPQRLHTAAVKNRKGPFHTSSSSPGSDDPDLIPLQKTKHLGKYFPHIKLQRWDFWVVFNQCENSKTYDLYRHSKRVVRGCIPRFFAY